MCEIKMNKKEAMKALTAVPDAINAWEEVNRLLKGK